MPRSRHRPFAGVGLPDALTPATLAVCAWGGATGGWLTGVLPGVVAAVFVAGDYALWARRGRPWHDAPVVVGLLPALAAGLWLGIGGTVLADARGDTARLLFEIGPGLALTGLVCTLVSYHGRHHPGESA